MTEHTPESDQELWARAGHRAPSTALGGRMLTQEERDWARDQIHENDLADERERAEDRAGYNYRGRPR